MNINTVKGLDIEYAVYAFTKVSYIEAVDLDFLLAIVKGIEQCFVLQLHGS
jgi:hypothetical protein